MNYDVTATAKLDNYATAKQIAQALVLSKSGFYSLCRRGQLPAGVKVGHSRRWRIDEVNAWLDNAGTTWGNTTKGD